MIEGTALNSVISINWLRYEIAAFSLMLINASVRVAVAMNCAIPVIQDGYNNAWTW